MKLLFTNIGRRTYMVEFACALKCQGMALDIFVADCVPETPGFHVSSDVENLRTPPVNNDEDAYAQRVLELCGAHGIDVVIPLSDFEIPVLAAWKDRFAEAGTRIVVSDHDVVENCMDKQRFYATCLSNGIPTPRTFFSEADFDGVLPCVQKRIRGSASAGLSVVRDGDNVPAFHEGRDMRQAFIEGREYHLDILNDFNGDYLHCCAKEKISMRVGETDKSRIVENDDLTVLAGKLSAVFGHVGNMDADVIVNAMGEPFCIDLNPRFGGGYPTTHLAGLNYLEAILEMARGSAVPAFGAPLPLVVMKGISLHAFEAAP